MLCIIRVSITMSYITDGKVDVKMRLQQQKKISKKQ